MSLNPMLTQEEPRLPLVGIKNFSAAFEETRYFAVTVCSMPYEMSRCCSGNIGENSEAIVPSGRTSARYSPLEFRLKLVWRGAPAMIRFLPEAKITISSFACKLVLGKVHF